MQSRIVELVVRTVVTLFAFEEKGNCAVKLSWWKCTKITLFLMKIMTVILNVQAAKLN